MKLEFKKDGRKYGEPALGEKSKASIWLLYLAYFWMSLSVIAHFAIWQATHQGVSDYGIFVIWWLVVTTVIGAGVLACLIVLCIRD